MQRSMRAAATAAILVALLLPTDAMAQMDPRENPTKKGPLRRDGGQCRTDRQRAAGGLAAVSRACSDVYSFNPLKESKPRRDYGAVWLQATVDTQRGWCARSAVLKITVPKGVRIEDRTPTFKRTDRTRRVRARLVVDAGGTADRNGVLKKHFRLHPRRIKPNVEGRTLTLDWKGNTGKTLGFAAGVEVSWNADNGFPDASPRSSVVSVLRRC